MTCAKVRHATREGAVIAAKRVKIASLNPYQCSKCKGWHLGNSRSPFRVQQRIDQILGKAK